MPIVTSQIIKIIDKPEGQVGVYEEHTDQTGKIRQRRYYPDASDDHAASLAAYAVVLDARLPELEAREEAARAASGEGVYVANHQTEAELDRGTLAELMQIRDAADFSKSLQWFRDFEVRAGANSNARATYLGVLSAEYAEVETRYNQITGITTGLSDDALRVWNEEDSW